MLGLADEVDALIASSSLPVGKPDPRAFRAALERVGVGAEEALMIGNSLDKDIRGALQVGLQAILVDRRGEHHGLDIQTVTGLGEVHFAATSPPDD